MRHYCLQQNIVSLIKKFYERFDCGVILSVFRGPNSDKTGMYALTTAFYHHHRFRYEDRQRNIKRRHTVGDFLRSIGIQRWPWLRRWPGCLGCTQAQIREKNEKVWQTARSLGLEINAPKTQVMCINITLDAPFTVAIETLECVDSFHIPWKCDK